MERKLLLGVERKLFDEPACTLLRRQLIAFYPSGAVELGEVSFCARPLCQQQRFGAIGLRQGFEQRALYLGAGGQMLQRLASAGAETVSKGMLERWRGRCFAQAHRQAAENDFAQRAVVVAAAELRQLQPTAFQRRRFAQDAQRCLQFSALDFRCFGEADNYAQRLFVAEGHQHAHADVSKRCLVTAVVEHTRQRKVECDAQYAHLPPQEQILPKEATRVI